MYTMIKQEPGHEVCTIIGHYCEKSNAMLLWHFVISGSLPHLEYFYIIQSCRSTIYSPC